MRSGSTVLLTAINVTDSGFRPTRAAARAIRSRTVATFSAIVVAGISSSVHGQMNGHVPRDSVLKTRIAQEPCSLRLLWVPRDCEASSFLRHYKAAPQGKTIGEEA